MAELQVQNYEEFKQREDVTYDEIEMDKEKIETKKLVVATRIQWLKHFLLILTISVFSAGIASSVTYFTVCAHLKQFTLDLVEIKLRDIERKNEIKVQEMENRYNLTSSRLQEQIDDSTELVGLTASGKGAFNRSANYQLRFPVIKFAIGISNLSSMKNNGTFICEKKGMYLILVTVMVCQSGDSGFEIVKNNQQLISYYIGRSFPVKNDCHSGTGTAVINLDVHDAIQVKYQFSSGQMYEIFSSFSAVKLH